MITTISQKELGSRIAILRKNRGLSQEDLAKKINISRPSLAQIELGKRNLGALELQSLALTLRFSLDDFLSKNFNTKEELKMESIFKQHTKERIAVPTLQISKLKNVLLYLLEKCAGKPNIGESAIYKLLYFCDFNYYEIYEEHLTGAEYQKLPYGPMPQKSDKIITKMIASKELQRIHTNYQGTTQIRYLPLVKANLTQLKASEKDVIDKVIERFSDWSDSAITDYSHKDMPWLASKNGEVIGYELAFYRETPFSVRNYGDEINEL